MPLQYDTEIVKLQLGTLVVDLYQVTNVDEVFDALINADPTSLEVVDERIPYWTELWPAAIALATYIEENKIFFQDKKVLELACGLALPAIIAGRFCNELTISDYLEDSLIFAKKNWALNHEKKANFELLDWRKLHLVTWPDIILISDVAYEKKVSRFASTGD